MKWIFKTFTNDFLRIYLPGLLALTGLILINGHNGIGSEVNANHSQAPLIVIIFNFLVFSCIDMGHTYTTMIKTYFDGPERKNFHMVWLTPIMAIAIMLIWRYFFDFRWFWVSVLYFTLFHHQRQSFGIMKWYESLNKNFYKSSKLFFNLITWLPFIAYHFRGTMPLFGAYYPDKATLIDVPINPTPVEFLGHLFVFQNIYHAVTVGLWFAVVNIWFLWEVNNYLTFKKLEINRILSIVFYGGSFAYSFLISTSYLESFTLLVTAHGAAYMFMLNKRVVSLPHQKAKGEKWLKKIPFFIVGIAVLGAIVDTVTKYFVHGGNMDTATRIFSAPTLGEMILIMMYVVPSLSHYIWDGYLWKKWHPDWKYFLNDEEQK